MPLCGPAFFSPPKSSPMGTRKNYPGWVPYQRLDTPLFLPGTSMRANVVGHTRGPGPASLLKRYGQRKRSIKPGVPFGKGTGGVLAGRSGPE
jgi:hypothetical protein